MKRKRPARYEQSLKEQENSSSTKSFRSNITGKLQTLLNGFVSELQSISEDKRQDVALLFSSKYKEASCNNDSSAVKSAFPSLSNSPDSTKELQNFINSAKSRISGLLSNKQECQGSVGKNLLKNIQSHAQTKVKSHSIDPLEIQINLKFQSLLFKAFDTKKANHADEKQEITTSESVITEKDWQDFSRMLQDFSQSSKKKLPPSLTKERNTQFLNGSVSVQNSPVKESLSSRNTQPSLVSQRKSQIEKLKNHSTDQRSSFSCPKAIDSNKLTTKNAKLLKMDFSSESTDSSPRNPFDEGCMLLLSDAEKCPSYVDLHLTSDSDEPDNGFYKPPDSPVQQSESEDDVIVLGEKSKTYQEVTLEEDDDGQVYESVVEKVAETCPKKEKEMFNCTQCDKSYRVQSLLQFHIKMHSAESPNSKASEYNCPVSSSGSGDESMSSERPTNLNERKIDIFASQDALVSEKNFDSNGELNILDGKLSKIDSISFKKVCGEMFKLCLKCKTYASEKFSVYLEALSSDGERGFLINIEIKNIFASQDALVSEKNFDSYGELNILDGKPSKIDSISFKIVCEETFKLPLKYKTYASEKFSVYQGALSSDGERGFLINIEIKRPQDMTMLHSRKSLSSLNSHNNLKQKQPNETIIRKHEVYKPSSNQQKAKVAAVSPRVSCSLIKGQFLRTEQSPDLSTMCDLKSLVFKKSPNNVKEEHSVLHVKSIEAQGVSEISVNCEKFASEDAKIPQKILCSIPKRLISIEPTERCPDNPNSSMFYDEVLKPSSNQQNFESKDAAISPGVSSSYVKGQFLRTEQCPDLSMICGWKSSVFEKSPNNVKEEHSVPHVKCIETHKASKNSVNCEKLASDNAKIPQKILCSIPKRLLSIEPIERCSDSQNLSIIYDEVLKPSSNQQNFESKDAATSPSVSCSFVKGRFLRTEQCPNISITCDWKSSVYEKNASNVKEEHSVPHVKNLETHKASKISVNCEKLASEDAKIPKKILCSIPIEILKTNDSVERCPDNPDLSMFYDTDSDSEYNHKNLPSDEKKNISKSRSKLGFLEGPIERCPEYVDLSMFYDWQNLDGSQLSDDEKPLKQNNEASSD